MYCCRFSFVFLVLHKFFSIFIPVSGTVRLLSAPQAGWQIIPRGICGSISFCSSVLVGFVPRFSASPNLSWLILNIHLGLGSPNRLPSSSISFSLLVTHFWVYYYIQWHEVLYVTVSFANWFANFYCKMCMALSRFCSLAVYRNDLCNCAGGPQDSHGSHVFLCKFARLARLCCFLSNTDSVSWLKIDLLSIPVIVVCVSALGSLWVFYSLCASRNVAARCCVWVLNDPLSSTSLRVSWCIFSEHQEERTSSKC